MKILILRLKFFLFLFFLFPLLWGAQICLCRAGSGYHEWGRGGGATSEKEVKKKENLSYHYTPDVNAREPRIKAFDALVNGPTQDWRPSISGMQLRQQKETPQGFQPS